MALPVFMLVSTLFLVGCVPGPRWEPAGADVDPGEKAAVLNAVDAVLEAMGRRDTAAYADLVRSDGMTYSQRWVDGQWRLRPRSNQQDIEMLDDEAQPLEESYWQPTVLLRGPMAVVWAPYEFRAGGVRTHCGVDVFEMLKIDGRWVMGNAMWTVEPDACGELRPRPETQIRPTRLAKP